MEHPSPQIVEPRRRRRGTWLLFPLFVLVVAALAPLLGWRPQRDPPHDRLYVDGEVVGVDSEKNEVVVHVGLGRGAHDERIDVSGGRFTLGQVEVPISEVHPGDHATIRLAPARPRATDVRLSRADAPP